MCNCESRPQCEENTNLLTKSELAALESAIGYIQKEMMDKGKWTDSEKMAINLFSASWKLPKLTGNKT